MLLMKWKKYFFFICLILLIYDMLDYDMLFYFILKINSFNLISSLNFSSKNKDEICVEAKIIKKTCLSVKTQTELLNLIQTNLKDLKQTMTKKNKKYYVIFIYNF